MNDEKMEKLENDLNTLHSNIDSAAQAAEEGNRDTAANLFRSFANDVELLKEKYIDVDE